MWCLAIVAKLNHEGEKKKTKTTVVSMPETSLAALWAEFCPLLMAGAGSETAITFFSVTKQTHKVLIARLG